MSDTCSAALATSAIIAQGRRCVDGQTCVMHAQELVLKHAIGVAVRMKGKQVVDEFECGLLLRDKAKVVASKLYNKKAKGRWKEIEAISQRVFSVKPIKPVVPSETRISGVFALFQSLIKLKCLIEILPKESKTQAFQEGMLSKVDWVLLTEFEGIMQATNLLAFTSQTDLVGELGFSWYGISLCRAKLCNVDFVFEIADVQGSWNPSVFMSKIPRRPFGVKALSLESQKFVERLLKNFDHYFPVPDNDQLLAMKLHPLMVYNGFKYVYIWNNVFEK